MIPARDRRYGRLDGGGREPVPGTPCSERRSSRHPVKDAGNTALACLREATPAEQKDGDLERDLFLVLRLVYSRAQEGDMRGELAHAEDSADAARAVADPAARAPRQLAAEGYRVTG